MSHPASEGFRREDAMWLSGLSTAANEWELEMLRTGVFTELDSRRLSTEPLVLGAPIEFSYFRSETDNELSHLLVGTARMANFGFCRYVVFNGEQTGTAGTNLRCYEAMTIGEMAVVHGSSATKPAEVGWTPDLLGASTLLALDDNEVSLRRGRQYRSLQAWFAVRQPIVQAYQPAFFGTLMDLLEEVPVETRQDVHISTRESSQRLY